MTSNSGNLQQSLRRVEELLHVLESCPDAEREAARELVRALLNLHTAGLAKVLELSDANAVARFTADPLVSALLLLHGLHPLPADKRVGQALERARPRFRAHGGDVELVDATDEVVRLRLRGDSGAGGMLRRLGAELVMEAAPQAAIEFEEEWEASASGRVPLPVVSAPPRPKR